MIFSDVTEIEIMVVLLVKLGRICASTQELCIAKKLKILFLIFFFSYPFLQTHSVHWGINNPTIYWFFLNTPP